MRKEPYSNRTELICNRKDNLVRFVHNYLIIEDTFRLVNLAGPNSRLVTFGFQGKYWGRICNPCDLGHDFVCSIACLLSPEQLLDIQEKFVDKQLKVQASS